MSREIFNNRVRWKVYNQEFKQIDSYSYSGFKFNFTIKEQSLQEEFTEFITVDRTLMPWELCDFFLARGINYSIHFKFIKGAKLSANFKLFKTVIYLKLGHLRLIINKHVTFEKQIEKKLINGKERTSVMLKLFLPQKYKLYFFQADSNVWWMPKIVRKESELVKITSIGWLFSQVGRCIYSRENDNKNGGGK